jgi:hypothetical protein
MRFWQILPRGQDKIKTKRQRQFEILADPAQRPG